MNDANCDKIIDLDVVRKSLATSWSKCVSSSKFRISFTEFEISKIESVIDQVNSKRLNSSFHSYRCMVEMGIDRYVPVRIENTLHIGPIIEKTTLGLMIVDGVHRIKACSLARENIVYGWLVQPQDPTPPPSAMVPISEIRVNYGNPTRKFSDYSLDDLFRPGETLVKKAKRDIILEIDGG